MTVNASIRNYLLSIDGLNCTTALVEFSGSDSKIDQSGLVTFAGQLKLGRPVGFESIDDRVNPRWSRGRPILFDVATEANVLARPTRFGTLFISDAVYDRSEENSGRLTLQVVDLLGLLMNATGDEDAKPKACVEEGGTSALSAINELLSKAGVPAALLVTDPIPGTVNAPINGGGGFIATAGAIAAAQGWFLYIDGLTGRVRARSIDVDAPTPIGSLSISGNAASFGRLPDKPPAQKMVVTGSGTIVTAIPRLNEETVSRTFGTLASIGGTGTGEVLVRERVTRESIVGSVRTLSVIVNEALGSLFPDRFPGDAGRIEAETYTEVHSYEAQSPVTGTGSDCENGNQGRLLSTIITSRKSFGTVFKGLVAKQISDGLTGGLTFSDATLTFLTDDYTEQIFYQYTNPEIGSGRNLGRGPFITRTKTGRKGAYLADYYSVKSYRPIPSGTYTETIPIESEQQYWFQDNSGLWRYEHTFRQAQIISKEGDIARSHAAAKKAARTVDAAHYAALVTIAEDVTTSANNTPPAPETLPPRYSVDQKEGRAEYQLPVDGNWPYREKSQTLSFEYLNGNSAAAINASAYGLARLWGVIGWGRYRGSIVQSNLTNYLHSIYRPADRVEVNEIEFVSSNLGDGYSVGMAGGELLVSIDCMYLGRTVPPAAASTVLSLDGLRSIGPADRYEGMIAYNP